MIQQVFNKRSHVQRSSRMIVSALCGTTRQAKKRSFFRKLRSMLVKIKHIVFFPFTNIYLRFLLLFVLIAGIAGLATLLKDLPSPRRLTNSENYAVSTQIFDRNGVLLYEIFADENRVPIKLDDLPAYVAQASIAIEDQNFYRHFGFDISGIIRAIRSNLTGKRVEGGSTITQQLVKNALLTRERSLKRKMKEGILAIITEAYYSKHDILEMYLNYISYGGTSVGIESAAKSYFGKSAKDLSIAEAALLAGLPQAPSKYSPFASDTSQAKERQQQVLRRMYEDGYITKIQQEEAANEVLHYAISKTDIKAPHFVFYVRDLLYQKFGEELVEKGGLRVITTLDYNLHQAAQATLSAEVEKLANARVSNGAALITKPNTGEILAMIGSKDYFDTEHDGQVNVTIRPRQPGSSIKPLVYATAFQQKVLNPGTALIDAPTCFSVAGQKPYCPKNYDGSFHGQVTVRQALGNSYNIPAVKAVKIVGLDVFMAQAQKMGITSWTDASNYGLSLSLGGGEVKMIDMAQAFSVLANQGVKVPLTPFLEITDYTGKQIEKVDVQKRLADLQEFMDYDITEQGGLTRVMDRAPAYLVSHIMQDNTARMTAFGPRSQLVIPNQVVSAKTGTTNDLKDNWTVGFTPEYLTIAWVGNNDGSQMNQRLVSGVTGAAPIFNKLMSFILTGREPRWQEKPPDVLSAQVCVSGFPKQAGDDCAPGNTELYWKASKPSNSVRRSINVWIDPTTGLPPKFGEQPEGLVLETRTILEDPLTRQYCQDCARPTDENGKILYEQSIVDEVPQNKDTQE